LHKIYIYSTHTVSKVFLHSIHTIYMFLSLTFRNFSHVARICRCTKDGNSILPSCVSDPKPVVERKGGLREQVNSYIHTYINIYIYIYIYIYVCVYICAYVVNMYVYVYAHVCIFKYVCMCVCIGAEGASLNPGICIYHYDTKQDAGAATTRRHAGRLYIYICVCMYVCMYVYMCVYIYICIYMYIYMCVYTIYIHMYIYAYNHKSRETVNGRVDPHHILTDMDGCFTSHRNLTTFVCPPPSVSCEK
jgi:hypothetical protein